MTKKLSVLIFLLCSGWSFSAYSECYDKNGKDISKKMKNNTEKDCIAAGGAKFEDDDYCVKKTDGKKRIPSATSKKACESAGGKWINSVGDDKD
ncbi:MAG: hypothetical protein HQK54_13780 [Oligoflexales bacterium]|nr:hypothetical protein [Oligoflexales bacterium]